MFSTANQDAKLRSKNKWCSDFLGAFAGFLNSASRIDILNCPPVEGIHADFPTKSNLSDACWCPSSRQISTMVPSTRHSQHRACRQVVHSQQHLHALILANIRELGECWKWQACYIMSPLAAPWSKRSSFWEGWNFCGKLSTRHKGNWTRVLVAKGIHDSIIHRTGRHVIGSNVQGCLRYIFHSFRYVFLQKGWQ